MRSVVRSRAHALGSLLSLSVAVAAYDGCSSDEPGAGSSDAGADQSVAEPDATTANDGGTDAHDARDATGPDVVGEAAPSDAGADVLDADANDGSFDCTTDDAGDGVPNHLRCTGLYADWSTKTIASDVRGYTPGYVLWSDGALKSRFVWLPPGATIDVADLDEWTFPVGTKLWKEFRLGTQRVETRFFVKTGAQSWAWTVYRWSTDEQSAVRLETGEQNVNDAGYEIPTTAQCMLCHGGRKDKVLGFDAIGLGAATAQGTTLATLVSDHLVTSDASVPTSIELPEDSTNLARQPFGWLHANCGVACHNSNVAALAAGSGLWLRASAKKLTAADAGTVRVSDMDAYKTSVGVLPVMGTFAGQGYRRIKANDPDKSLIPLLDSTRDNDASIPQMPPIVSHVPPTTDVNALRAWITAMNPDGG